ncbi:MAG TPA: M48 family metalloprotease [Acidobacteriaceae bacterium]|nr:M48 family metalloprotease [Acidobacteriaceae bacterium]
MLPAIFHLLLMTLRNAVRPFAPALVLCVPLCTFAQQKPASQSAACGAPPIVAPDSRPNYFSEQQEEWLGEAMADQAESEFRLVRDPAENAYLQAIVDRLAATLPDTHIHFHVQIVDSPEVNGFSLAGGRIYVTRKLLAEAKSDDELASVLGHEMGHIASHQFAFDTTTDMKKLLGVTSVGDRADVFHKAQQLAEAYLQARAPANNDDDKHQEEADRVAVYVISAAGYRPQAFADFWDRVEFTKGKSGGALSNFFGMTKPNERRLGRIQKLIAALPPGCGAQQAVQSAGFAVWHERVLENRGAEAAHIEGAQEIPLTPPLRMDLERLRFSPDGSKLLAQDESTIFVLNRDPLKVEFKIDAPNALAAQFSPDSKRVVFTTHGLHTEEWSIAQQKLMQVHEPLTKYPCVQTKLSSDGRTVICLQWNPDTLWMDLSLLDSGSGQVVWEKNDFFQPNMFFALLMSWTDQSEWAGDLVPSSFSADGNYLLIGPDERKLAFDLRTRTPVRLGSGLINLATTAYAFLGNDRVAGVNRLNPKNSGIYSFPDGKQLKKVMLPFLTLRSVSAIDGSSYVLSDGYKDFQVSLSNVDAGQVILGSESEALDVWGGVLASENRDGHIILSKIDAGKVTGFATAEPPESQLARLYSVALSPDGQFLAMSTRTRGGLWNLRTGKRLMYVRGFHGAWNGDDLIMEFPKHEKQDARLIDASTKTMHAGQVKYALGDMNVEYGMLDEWKDAGKHAQDLVVHRTSDGSELWRRTFSAGKPYYTASYGWKDLLFSFHLNSSYAKAQVKSDPTLSAEAAIVKKKDDGRLIEVVDAATGKTTASVVVELSKAYAGTYGLNRVGDLLYATTQDDRTQVYSLKDGRLVRQVYGTMMGEDVATGRICLRNREDEAMVYDASGKELAHVQMGTPVRFAAFVDSGAKVALLGADQVVRMVPIRTTPPTALASSK